jgi:hypothetical protein
MLNEELRGLTMTPKTPFQIGRRELLLSAGGMAALPLAGLASAQSSTWGTAGQAPRTYPPAPKGDGAVTPTTTGSQVIGRRRLGSLEVSSLGIGVQNNSRKYTTETPYRPEQVALLRGAFDQGVTFFDCAEAYVRTHPR